MVALISAFLALAAANATEPAPAPAAGVRNVEVHFTAPERYRDALPSSTPPQLERERQREAVLTELRSHLQQLGQRHLQPGDRLTIEVLDLDLAGEIEPVRGGQETRVLRADTGPSMTLRVALERAGARSEATEGVADPGYQSRTATCRSGEFLCYEKRMLSDWFDKRFGRGSGQ